MRLVQWTLRAVLYGLMIWALQEIYNSQLHKDVWPGIIRLIMIEVGAICRVVYAIKLADMKKTLLPECILLSLNTIQLAQYTLYEVLQ